MTSMRVTNTKHIMGYRKIVICMIMICLLNIEVIPASAAESRAASDLTKDSNTEAAGEPAQDRSQGAAGKPTKDSSTETDSVTDRALDQEQHRVRVGFFAFDGYHMVDSQGRRSGYGYDYLQYLARYTSFDYEYVGYDKSWKEMKNMLENGEIDILTSARRTPERLGRFDFSDQPIGSSACILTVKAGDNRYMTDDYTQLDGIRIGLLEGNSRNESLEQFARENGFSYEPVYYECSLEMEAALKAGEKIDAIMTSSLRKIQGEWIIASFDNTPFYVMVKKGNQQLLNQINSAIAQLQIDHKDLDSILFERYYTADNGDEIAFTAQERAYIKEFQESGNKVSVTINSGREPVSYFADGEARGIIPEIAREVLRRTGLPYELINTPPTVDARDLLRSGEADVRFDGISDFNYAEHNGLLVTDPYLELPLSCVMLRNFAGEPSSVAVIRNSDVVEEYVQRVYDETDITRYDSADECLDAVISGRQDAAFFQTYIAQRLVNADVGSRLRDQLVPGYGMSFAVSVDRDNNLLFSIMDKAVFSLSTEEINQIVLEQTSHLSREISLLGYLYQHPSLWIALLGGCACFSIILILYLARRKNLRLEQEKAMEFERFISYVCQVNNEVIEIEADGRLCRMYQVNNGKVTCREMLFDEQVLRKYSIHPEDRENVDKITGQDVIRHLIESGNEVYFECRLREWEERYQWFAFTLQGVSKDEGNEGSLMVFVKNIDRAKQEEYEKRQALQDALTVACRASEARGTFLSRMSHEIRTPLNAIIGYLTIAAASLDNPPKAEECLKKSDFAAHQLLNIVNDVLDISAIESGKMKIAHEEFNMKELLSGITSIFHSQAVDKGVDLQVRLSDLTEENLIGDQFRLNQILLNLLSNAVKFTSTGGRVTFRIQQKTLDAGRAYLQFEVEDTGIGMSEDYKKRLFQPFEQQDAATARKFGGTGLGLSITKNLVSMMNGTIDVKSEEGKGTLFTVNLSFDIARDGDMSANLYDFGGLHVLVVYDENSDYKYMKYLLERFGVTFDMTLSLDEAVDKLRDKYSRGQRYDLCLIDWDMKEGQSLEAARTIKAEAADLTAAAAGCKKADNTAGKEGPAKPVIMAAAYEAPKGTGHDPIQDVILKPVFQSSLFDALSNICKYQCEEMVPDTEGMDFGLKGMRILLAEDNELNMEIATDILTDYGLIVDGVPNGLEAVKRFEESEESLYQAVLMDIQMPVLNGYEAASRIRACAHPQACTIPIIALTADAFAEDINRALAAGMDGHVSKPVDFTQLCSVLARCISNNRNDLFTPDSTGV